MQAKDGLEVVLKKMKDFWQNWTEDVQNKISEFGRFLESFLIEIFVVGEGTRILVRMRVCVFVCKDEKNNNILKIGVKNMDHCNKRLANDMLA